jgi:hypothetical protein
MPTFLHLSLAGGDASTSVHGLVCSFSCVVLCHYFMQGKISYLQMLSHGYINHEIGRNIHPFMPVP